ncbi:hypothetical protein [Rhodococcus sp. IEGM 1408]|uniref:hypothetical protein n=1 Tax=Rhodococcus sp. IEGM 1408 TaxID=3082220 RepID=UPI00295554EC|nr:hypothetical protein [Rhodococcus sp. IEGM 1408]MDV8002869.1 hypothetical protein [Rhodococcus sp. IEGM 1408]
MLNHTELHYLTKTQSLHGLGRLAATPDTQIKAIAASSSAGYCHDYSYEYRANGLSVWLGKNRPWNSAPDLLITWTKVRHHIARYVTEEFIAAFRETDKKWCEAKSATYEAGQFRRHTDAELAHIADLEALLKLLAAPIWEPATTIDGEPQQLDLFA